MAKNKMVILEHKILENLAGTTPENPLSYKSLTDSFPTYMKLAVVQAVSGFIERGKVSVWATVDTDKDSTCFWIALFDGSP